MEEEDKSTWGDGPWMSEPDYFFWTDEATKLPCLVRRGYSGAWCGYVGIDESHPLYENTDIHFYESVVHGGLSFADKLRFANKVGGAPLDLWWFGFDCSHASDYLPKLGWWLKECSITDQDWKIWQTFDLSDYRDIEYAKHECLILANELLYLAYKTRGKRDRESKSDGEQKELKAL